VLAQISRTSYYRWLEKGEKSDIEERDDSYRAFFLKVKRTLAEAELYSLSVIAKAQEEGRPDSWRAAAWLLERRWPTKWGSRRHQIESRVNANVVIDDPSDREERVKRISELLSHIPSESDVDEEKYPEPLSQPELESGTTKEEKEKKKRVEIPA
jgi:hypothetical protein